MPALKPISGHSKSVKAAILYLTQKERALASDFVNCREVDRRGRQVWEQMDQRRHALGCDVPTQGHRNVRTYEHFVLSPDPRDHIDLQTLRDLAVTWAKEYFGDYQVAIYYHDDNAGRIPHAHLIVNNANLRRPGRVSTILTPKFEGEIFRGLQRLASERGLHGFTERATSVNNADWAKADRERMARERPKGTVQLTYRSRQDKELEAKGISWKRDVRDRIACALALSSTEDEFVDACRALGLGVDVSQGRHNAGEYVYAHPSGPMRHVSGRTLGRDWSRWGVQRRLARDRQRKVAKPDGKARAKLLEAMGSLSTADGALALQVLGTAKGVPITAAAVTDMIEVCESMDIRSDADFQAALREPMPPDDRARLRDAMRLARALGHLPRERDKVDGPRIKRSSGVGTRRRHVAAQDGTAPVTGSVAETSARDNRSADVSTRDEQHR
jgi:hypothetical protein